MLLKSRKKGVKLGGKPVICFVAPHCCIRVIKEAMVLRDLGYKVHLVTERDERNNRIFASISRYASPKDLSTIVSTIAPSIDLWVVHNEPNWPVTLLRETLGDVPIILEMHDSNYWRIDLNSYMEKALQQIHWNEEDVAVNLADAFIVPSKACVIELSTRTAKPIAWLPPAVPRNMFSYMGVDFKGGVVSQGGHVIPAQVHGDHWRDYTQLYSEITKHKLLYVYSPAFTFDKENPIDKHYIDLGNGNIRLGSMKYDDLIVQVGCHTWNLVGNTNNALVWQYALPNKFFDAMASGTPSVVFNCSQVKEIVDLFDIGIYVNDVQELLDRWDEHKEKRTNLMLSRKDLCMEAFIHQITDLYDEVLK